jgi:methylenetetrahydrofolate dehydrogenase (NADP+)/methenyltetrahydrofolate cyclohydrolase
MSAQLLEGKPVAEAVLADVAARVVSLKDRGVVPGLGTILVGNESASAGYVRKKHELCQKYGIQSFDKRIPADGGQAHLFAGRS